MFHHENAWSWTEKKQIYTWALGQVSLLEMEYLEDFHFRWSNIKEIDGAFPISITLFSNHLK